jgi:TM2 domain-containing membrane protein YozV
MEEMNQINNNVSEISKDQIKIANDKKLISGICGILLGSFGIHKFYLGYTKEGLIMLLVSLLTCGVGAFFMSIIGLIEGVTYLTKSDEDFYKTYIVGHKGWF